MVDDDHVGRVGALDDDRGLLRAGGGERRPDAGSARAPEEPRNAGDREQAGDRHQDLIDGHGWASLGFQVRNRLALLTTVTELKAIATEAISGESSRPVSG